MKRFTLLTVLLLTFFCIDAMAQSSMTDEQVIQFVMKEHEAGTSQAQIVTKLMQRGVDISQIRRVRNKYERMTKGTGLGTAGKGADNGDAKRLRSNNGGDKAEKPQYRIKDGSMNSATRTYDKDDEEFMMMQEEMTDILPADTATLLKQLMEEKNKKKVFGRDIFNN